MSVAPIIVGDKSREAIEALRGYVYQLYQSAAAWVELSDEEYLFLEIAEDYAVAAVDAISAVKSKTQARPSPSTRRASSQQSTP